MNLVRAIGRALRNSLMAGAGLLDRLGGSANPLDSGHLSPFAYLHKGAVEGLVARVRLRPGLLLQIREVRGQLSRERIGELIYRKAVRRVSGDAPDVAHNTLEYNLAAAVESPDMDRPNIMIGVVMGIEKVWKNVGNLDILSVGPRSESEIFALMAAGFNPNRIKALDLFSYSPYVDIGDMHAMPYPAQSFDVVLLGWVLSYSKDQAKVAGEILRVAKPGAIVALAGDYSDNSRDRPAFENETTHMQSCDQLLALFQGHIGRVYFRHDPDPPSVAMVMTVFEGNP